jgi:hypothetical protein
LAVFVTLKPSVFISYIESMNQTLAPGGNNDYSLLNERFFDLTSIHTVIYFISNSRTAVTIISSVISLFILLFILLKRDIYIKESSYSLVIFILFSLLFVYHRTYDSLILATLFIWLKPSELIDKIKWKVIVLLPVLLPLTGLVMRFKTYIPETVYFILLLNIPLSLTAFLIIMIFLPFQDQNRLTLQ